MSARILERDHLSTFSSLAEIHPLKRPENAIFFNSPKKIEYSPYLRVNQGLQKANWQSTMEMKRFVDDINTDLSRGSTLEEAVARSTELFADHIRYYDAEFIEQEPILIHSNQVGLWNGEVRLLGNNSRPVVDAIDSRERQGATKRVASKIEKDLLQIADDSFIVLMSSQGVSGYLDEYGRDIPHLNSQVMVFWKDTYGNSRGATLVTDLKIDQAEKVMQDLGSPVNFLAKKGTEMQRVVSILENPVQPSLAKTCHNPVAHVFSKILAVRGDGDLELRQKKGPPETIPVRQVWQKIGNLEKLLERTLTKEKLVQEFKRFILDHYQQVGDLNFQQAMIEVAEETILLFVRDHLNRRNNQVIAQPIVFPQYTENAGKIIILRPPDYDFRPEIAFLQSRGGCPSSTLRALAGRSISVLGGTALGESDHMGSLYFPCPKCGTTIKRPWGDYAKRCDSCGATEEIACGPSSSQETKKEYNKENKEEQLAKAA